MARTGFESGSAGTGGEKEALTFQANGQERIELPSSDFITDAKMTREGGDLVLQSPNGESVVIEGYFDANPSPILQAANGATLTPNLVEAFSRSPLEFAATATANDESPVGAVEEVKGNATVTRADGTVETITIGTPIYEGDIVETDASGAVNIVFLDETSMAVSENARLAIDEYTFDPSSESGTTNFSVLRGLFVFTSGLIGRDDPDDVSINTPVGSIGIRGTVIAGEINPGGESKISVLEGAIVVKNGAMEAVISQQFETVTLTSFDQPINNIGTVPANDISTRFQSVGNVSPSLFTTINDAAGEQGTTKNTSPATETPGQEPTSSNQNTTPAPDALSSIDGSMATLDSRSSSGLPSSNGSMGQSSNDAGTGNTSASSAAPAPGATGQSGSTGGTTNNTSSTTNAPPPSVLEGGTGNGAGSGANGGGTITTPTRPAWANIDLNSVNATSHHLITDNIDNKFGYSISALGDVDGNGFDDFVVGKNSSSQISGSEQNHSYIIHGSAGGIVIPGPTGTVSNGTGEGSGKDYSQSIVSGIGDFNGDGTLDFAVGQEKNGTGSIGQVGVIGVNAVSIKIIDGTPNSQFGASVSGAGDFNNDGYADIVVGAPGYNGGIGQAVLIKGLASGTPTQDSLTGSLSLTSSAKAGSDVAGIGDFNGDGYSDVIVGILGDNRAEIFFGHKSGSPAPTSLSLSGINNFGTEVAGLGDINGDGYSDVMVASAGGSGSIFFGGTNNPPSSVNYDIVESGYTISGGGAAGDFNGDGYKDFVITLTDDATGSNTEGYIVFGKAGMSGTIGYTYLQDHNNAIKFTYSGTSSELEIASIGDVNGDGYDDIGIGVEDANGGLDGNGGMFVVYGRYTGNTQQGSNLTANAAVKHLVGSTSADTFDDGGITGVSMRGGAGNDTLIIHNTDFVNLNGGGGIDTLSVIGDLDFSDVNFEKISGVEVIKFDGADNQKITLTLENIFNLLKSSDSYFDGANNHSGFLKIMSGGNAGETLEIMTNSSTGGNVAFGAIDIALEEVTGSVGVVGNSAGGWDSFKIGGYMLLIESSIEVNLVT